MSLYRYANRKLLLVFMQPGCGPCHGIVPALNRLNDVGEVQVLVIHNGATEAVREWIKKNQPHFSVAVQDHFGLSNRYEAFATPFAFLIDERGMIAARGFVSRKQYLGFVLTRAGQDGKECESEDESPGALQGLAPAAAEPSLSSSKEVDHV